VRQPLRDEKRSHRKNRFDQENNGKRACPVPEKKEARRKADEGPADGKKIGGAAVGKKKRGLGSKKSPDERGSFGRRKVVNNLVSVGRNRAAEGELRSKGRKQSRKQ